MHLTGPVQSEILILYVLLMVTKTLSTTDHVTRIMTVNTTLNPKAAPMTTHKYILSREKLYQIAALQRIFLSIHHSRERIKKQSDIIRYFYAEVQNTLKGGVAYEWLPKEHFQFFENEIRHLEKHKKISKMIPILENSLEIFSFTFGEILSASHHGQHVVQVTVYETRQQILTPIVQDLNMTLEEVKNDVDLFRLKSTTLNCTEIRNRIFWNGSLDHTSVMVRDWSVISVYYKFIKDWEKIMRSLLETYCSMTSNNHKCHKFLKTNDDSVT